MHLTTQRRRPTRIKIDKSRILSNFPEKQYVEKAPGAGAQSGVFPDVRSRASFRMVGARRKQAPGENQPISIDLSRNPEKSLLRKPVDKRQALCHNS